jgi:two-component sensor histidine kinase
MVADRVELLELLLSETNHRCANDLQMAMGVLHLQASRSADDDVADALHEAARRIGVIATARNAFSRERDHGLETGLRRICEALQAQAEARSILLSFDMSGSGDGLSAEQIMGVSLAVNELVTNAIKHGFAGDGGFPNGGHITVSARRCDGNIVVTVDDDGLPIGPKGDGHHDGSGIGLSLVERLTRSVGASFSRPDGDGKCFTLKIPHG